MAKSPVAAIAEAAEPNAKPRSTLRRVGIGCTFDRTSFGSAASMRARNAAGAV